MTFRENPEGDHYINSASLLVEFQHFIESHPPLHALHQHTDSWPVLMTFCQELDAHRHVLKALTLLHTRSQIDFERALFCSWLSMLVARQYNLNVKHQRALFYAGLFQDLGRHAVESDVAGFISRVNGPYIAQTEKNRQLDSHPLVSSTYLETHFPGEAGLPELVLHHHARDDGTGFPQHIGEPQLQLDQQILIIANEVSDRLDRMGGHNQLMECLPSLRLGRALYFDKAHAAWLATLACLGQGTGAISARECQHLRHRRDALEKTLASLLAVSGELLRYDFDLHVHGLRSTIQKLARLFTDSGILNQALFEQVCQQGEQGEGVSCQTLLEVADMFHALPEVLQRCEVHMDYLLGHNEFEMNRIVLGEALQRIRQCRQTLQPQRASIFR